jgi:glycosyltransferase involved in cell wall biosynthesis
MGGRRPTLGFLGIHAAGRPGQPPGQDEVLAPLFRAEGYRVRLASSVRWPPLRTLDQIRALLTWRDVDVLVIATYSGPSFLIARFGTYLGRRVGRRKVVLFLHGGNLPVYGPEHRQAVTRTFDRADRILAPSPYLADAFRSWGYEVAVGPNVLPFDPSAAEPRSAARPALLWMRTFAEEYDPLAALEVLRLVGGSHPGATMTMAGGDQGLVAAPNARATELGLDSRVSFPGYLDAAGKADAFARHDLFLNTNRVDNTPVSVLEAAAAGVVPVAMRVGGIPALLTDGTDSVLIDPGDAAAMAAAVEALVDDPARFAALSVGARRLAERSTWPQVRAAWEAQFDALDAARPEPDGRSGRHGTVAG